MDQLKLMVAQEQRKDIVARVEQDALIAAARAGRPRQGAWQRVRAMLRRNPGRPDRAETSCRLNAPLGEGRR